MTVWCLVLAVALCLACPVHGHGRLRTPPSRSSCWRYGWSGCATNYNDMELFCGGYNRQWITNDGKCGVCGDPWDAASPRPNEAGGTYAKGVIVGSYQAGQTLDIVVELTAAHKGWFEFRLCENNDITKTVTHTCLDQHLLHLADGSGTRYQVGDSLPGSFDVAVDLPAGLTCSQCVLQWKYNTGNRWNDGCLGCGAQEQFYGCADIEIT